MTKTLERMGPRVCRNSAQAPGKGVLRSHTTQVVTPGWTALPPTTNRIGVFSQLVNRKVLLGAKEKIR